MNKTVDKSHIQCYNEYIIKTAINFKNKGERKTLLCEEIKKSTLKFVDNEVSKSLLLAIYLSYIGNSENHTHTPPLSMVFIWYNTSNDNKTGGYIMNMDNKIFTDERGFNMKFFEGHLANAAGFNEVKEVFATVNRKGVVRAFHWQSKPKPQQKIVKPLSGSFNVRVIDMENKVVKEYDNWGVTSEPIFVKEGNMLGYVALENDSVMVYIADEEFVGELNSGMHPFSFGVDWKYDGELVISDRDKKADKVNF